MRYRQPFHEKLENIVEGDRSDDARGVGAKGGSRAGVGARVRVGAGVCVRTCVRTCARVRAACLVRL